jgi:ectoine hydroxylase-related dioxygenase (phytanoyl-CoA dioxygenase family)
MLSDEQVRQYRDEGLCVVRDFLGQDVVRSLLQELDEVTAGATLAEHDKTKMEMEPNQEPNGSHVRRVYEPCDYYPHHGELSTSPALIDSVAQLVGPDVVFHYSKINMKPAQVGSPVEWHQDLAFYPLTNPDSVTVLFYLENADSETGCLTVLPGMHGKPLLDHTEQGYFAGRITERIDESKAVNLEGPGGTAIFMHCMTPHSSKPNHSSRSRRTLILGYRAADAYPIYMGEMTVKGETPVRIVRGETRAVARFAFSDLPIPKYRRSTSSLYELQEASRERAAIRN